MSDFIIYFAMLLAVIVIVVELWAIISVFRSDEPVAAKTFWALFIWIVPVIGLICWGIAGPSSPEHEK